MIYTNINSINSSLKEAASDRDARAALLSDPARFLEKLGIGKDSATRPIPKVTINNSTLGAYRP